MRKLPKYLWQECPDLRKGQKCGHRQGSADTTKKIKHANDLREMNFWQPENNFIQISKVHEYISFLYTLQIILKL